LENWGKEDGEATAEVLMVKTDAEKHHRKGETRAEARVRAMMATHKGLRELGEKHDWFEVLLAKVAANKLRPAGDSKAKLCNMSAKQAGVIGGALASCIAANLTAPAAVDEWILRYPAMGELEREYVRERNERYKELAAEARQRPTPTTARAKWAGRAGECANKRRQPAGGRGGRARQHPSSLARHQAPSLALASLARCANDSIFVARFASPFSPP
jgi:hypothetical protein